MKSTGASSCPFCGKSGSKCPAKFSGTLRPDFIIPFKLDKKRQPKERSDQNIFTAKILLPKSIKKGKITLTRSKGVYVPFWLFDTDASADIRYHATKDPFLE